VVKKVFTLGIILFITLALSGCYTSFHVADVKAAEVAEPPVPVMIYPEPVNHPIIVILPAPKPPTKLRKPGLRINNLNGGKLRSSAGTNSRGTHSRNGLRKNRRNSRS